MKKESKKVTQHPEAGLGIAEIVGIIEELV